MRHLRTRSAFVCAFVVPVILLTACGTTSKNSATSAAVTTVTGSVTTIAGTGTTVASGATTIAGTGTTVASGATTTTSPNKPKVQVPKTLPTKLIITDIKEGTGAPAKKGDIVAVNYIGVRSADGTEFDNSYDRGQTFPVTLGEGSVIKGWDQGLVGIKVGGRRQLDIPADLAYGNSPQGAVIKAGDALTFVIDAISITPGVDVPTANVEDKPTVDIKPSVGATTSSHTDLVVGTGTSAVTGSTAYLQLIAYRGDTGAEIQSSWETGAPISLPLDAHTLVGIVSGVTGMKIGGRRELIIPPADGFGEAGSSSLGLPANTDLILVVDLVQVAPAA
jgi:FKBP-type peptidyl-prolyl cis-trans isomerase